MERRGHIRTPPVFLISVNSLIFRTKSGWMYSVPTILAQVSGDYIGNIQVRRREDNLQHGAPKVVKPDCIVNDDRD